MYSFSHPVGKKQTNKQKHQSLTFVVFFPSHPLKEENEAVVKLEV